MAQGFIEESDSTALVFPLSLCLKFNRRKYSSPSPSPAPSHTASLLRTLDLKTAIRGSAQCHYFTSYLLPGVEKRHSAPISVHLCSSHNGSISSSDVNGHSDIVGISVNRSVLRLGFDIWNGVANGVKGQPSHHGGRKVGDLHVGSGRGLRVLEYREVRVGC